MGNKKAESDEPEGGDLEERVDAYMNTEAASIEERPGSAPPLPPLNIFVNDSPLDEGHQIEVRKHEKDEAVPTAPLIDTPATGSAEAAAGPEAGGLSLPAQTDGPPGIEAVDNSKASDDQIDPLVDDIVAHESDQLLAAEDEKIARAFAPEPSGRRNLLAVWWRNKFARYGTLGLLLVGLVAAGAAPASRYFILNNTGVRSAASITVLDSTTRLPLKNVSVTIGEVSGKTDQDGWVRLEEVKLGTQQLTVERLGFAQINRTVTLGLGSNPLGEEQLKAVGAQYRFRLVDFLSGKPVKDGEVNSGEAAALSDAEGKVVLTLDQPEQKKIPVEISARGYRSEKLEIDADIKKPVQAVMVTERKNVFISKQSGKYDVYKIDIDGRNKKLLLSGSGLETERLSLVQHPSKHQVALVSNRENRRNQDGFLLQTLTLINTNNGDTLSLDNSESIRIVDWIGDKLVYVKVRAGTSAGNVERFQLMSYDYETTAHMQLATANYFSDIVSARGNIYFAASSNYQPGRSQFVKISPDNTGRQILLESTVWTIIRSRYDGLTLNGEQGWHAYTLGDNSVKKLSAPPAATHESRFFLDSEDKKRALWTENRDGKGVLLSYNAEKKKDTVLATQSGLTYPLKWLDGKTVVYRVVTPGETADYVLSTDGGQPKKIGDVTNVPGFGRWFYY